MYRLTGEELISYGVGPKLFVRDKGWGEVLKEFDLKELPEEIVTRLAIDGLVRKLRLSQNDLDKGQRIFNELKQGNWGGR